MLTARAALEMFRDMKISLTPLRNYLDGDLSDIIAKPVIVRSENVIELLQLYLDNQISDQTILDWVNTIWFTDYFEYYTPQADSIASVMTELEMIDEDGYIFNKEIANIFIKVLRNNAEYYST